MKITSKITGTGSYIPTIVKDNTSFLNSTFYDDKKNQLPYGNDEVIRKFLEITGIESRRYAKDDLNTSAIGTIAAQKALEDAGIEKGNMAPDFTLADVINNNRSLSDYKGKLVLLQFWASWCHFCKIENPELVALLNNYNDKGFEILGISLDTKKNDWLDGIEHENLNFVNLSDLKGFDSPIANTYAINSIPQMYLVDEEGVIILITHKASDVTNKVEQHY